MLQGICLVSFCPGSRNFGTVFPFYQPRLGLSRGMVAGWLIGWLVGRPHPPGYLVPNGCDLVLVHWSGLVGRIPGITQHCSDLGLPLGFDLVAPTCIDPVWWFVNSGTTA